MRSEEQLAASRVEEVETALRQREEALRRQTNQFTALVERIPDIVARLDRQLRFLYISPNVERITGKPARDYIGKPRRNDGLRPEHVAARDATSRKVFETGQEYTLEFPIDTPTGQRFLECRFIPEFALDGSVDSLMTLTRDITERIQQQRALLEREVRYRALFDGIDEGFCIIEFLDGPHGPLSDYVHIEANPAYARHTGIANVVGQRLRDMVPAEADSWLARYRPVLETGRPIRFEQTLVATGRHLELAAFRVEPPELRQVAVLFTDVTARKQAQDQLRRAKEEAEAANIAKDKFLAVLSHELRTPLTPVMMSITAMDMDPDLPPAVRESIAMIRRNVELETKLIDDLLDLSRVTTGKLRLNMETVDVTEAVRHVCQTCRPLILEKGIHLHVELPDAPQFVRADNARLQQVLWNVIKNSAKFTPDHGHIHVTVSATPQQRVRLEIRDTGIGISADVLPRIFDAFEQGDANITRQFGGMGLGLAISKALVEMHGGTIAAQSEGEKRGSTFIIELPTATREPQPARIDGKPAGNNGSIRVLVVEDHADTATVLARLLTKCGHAVTTANSAAAALDLAAKEKFDVVVSDIGLPDSTGYDLMRQIAARFAIKGIAMSGYGMDEDLRKSREAGFSDHIVKPVNLAELERAIHRAARGN